MLTHEEAHVILVTDVRLGALDKVDNVRESRELRLGHGPGVVALLLRGLLVGDPLLEAVPRDGQALGGHGFGFGSCAVDAFFGGGFDEGG